MFCPNCAAENAEGAQFCRACGTNISLVPQALTGRLPARPDGGEAESGHKRGKPVTIDRAVQSLFMGIAFVFVAFAVRNWAPAGQIWWFWLFIPAAAMMADGLGTYLRLRERRQRELAPPAFSPAPQSLGATPRAAGLPPRNTGELVPPPSVTEGTTRHLGVRPERRREDV